MIQLHPKHYLTQIGTRMYDKSPDDENQALPDVMRFFLYDLWNGGAKLPRQRSVSADCSTPEVSF